MARRPPPELDRELADLPPELRWRTWMGRVEAVIFASVKPVSREVLARVVGEACRLDDLIDDIREELRGRPYELVAVAGGFQHRTRKTVADAIQASGVAGSTRPTLSRYEVTILMAIAYLQPITRAELGAIVGAQVSRDTIAAIRSDGFIASGPRAPLPGAPYTYVTTPAFLATFGFDTLRDLPDIEALEDAGLLGKDGLLDAEMPHFGDDEEEAEDVDDVAFGDLGERD